MENQEDQELVYFHNNPNIPNIPLLLRERFAERKVALFIGAGASMAVGAPGWDELVDDMLHDAGYKPETFSHLALEQKVSLYTYEQTRPALNRALKEQLNSHRDLEVHKALVSLPASIILTTNYDPHLKQAADELGRSHEVIVDDSEVHNYFETSERTIIHLYGDSKNPVATEEDLINFERNHPALSLLLQHVLLTNTVLFLGFSFRDHNILNHILRTHAMVGGHTHAHLHYAYMLDPKPHEIKMWSERKLKVLATKFLAEDFTKDNLSNTFKAFVNNLSRDVTDFSYGKIGREKLVKREESKYFYRCKHNHTEPILRKETTFSVLSLPDAFEVSGIESREGHQLGIERKRLYTTWLNQGAIFLLLNCNPEYIKKRRPELTVEVLLHRFGTLKELLTQHLEGERLVIGIRRYLDTKKGFTSFGDATLLHSFFPSDTSQPSPHKRTQIIRERDAAQVFNNGFDREIDTLMRTADENFDTHSKPERIRQLNKSSLQYIDYLIDKIKHGRW